MLLYYNSLVGENTFSYNVLYCLILVLRSIRVKQLSKGRAQGIACVFHDVISIRNKNTIMFTESGYTLAQTYIDHINVQPINLDGCYKTIQLIYDNKRKVCYVELCLEQGIACSFQSTYHTQYQRRVKKLFNFIKNE